MATTRVLIIEDDADINNIVATHLTRAGYTCTQAFSGTEAKLLLDSGNSPMADVVICDLMLPGLPGEELVRLIRERDQDTPIIVISARTAASDKVDLLKLGADDYLAKPFDLDELLARIEVQLRHHGRSSAIATSNDGVLRFRDWTWILKHASFAPPASSYPSPASSSTSWRSSCATPSACSPSRSFLSKPGASRTPLTTTP